MSRPAGQLRPAADGRPAGLRDLVVAGAARVARRGGRRDAARGSGLAARGDRGPREGRPLRQAAVAGRCRPGAGRRICSAAAPSEFRAVFLRVHAPAGALTRRGVGRWFMTRACGLGYRRSVRTGCGTPRRPRCSGRARRLAEIAQVLRHRESKTTAIYAKVDRTALRRARDAVAGEVRHDRSTQGAARLSAVRRQLGFELKHHGRMLEDFVEFMERAGAERMTTELALMWASCGAGAPAPLAPTAGWFAASLATWHDRPADRDPTRRPAARPPAASRRTSTHRPRSRADGGRSGAVAAVARGDVSRR